MPHLAMLEPPLQGEKQSVTFLGYSDSLLVRVC